MVALMLNLVVLEDSRGVYCVVLIGYAIIRLFLYLNLAGDDDYCAVHSLGSEV